MATLDQLKAVEIPSGSLVPLGLKEDLSAKALTFFGVADLASVPLDKWPYFAAAVANLYTAAVEVNSISKDAVDQMVLAMADNKIEDITEAKKATIAGIVESLQTFCNNVHLGDADKVDVPGVQRAITIIGRSL